MQPPALMRHDGRMTIDRHRTAVLALHWQVNVIRPEGFFGPMLAEPIAASGVVDRATRFHAAAQAAGLPLIFTRFTVPVGEGGLVRNTGFMRSVGVAQAEFRPDSPGTQVIPEMSEQIRAAKVFDNQKLSGLAGNVLPDWLVARGIDTVLITGVATNLTVEQTARHGTDLGFTVHPVSDCVAAATEEAHAASLADLELATAGCLSAQQVLEQAGALRH
jgi:nicotinamidase-related amidase